jgi:hypothetical protein
MKPRAAKTKRPLGDYRGLHFHRFSRVFPSRFPTLKLFLALGDRLL